jgi:AraC-like DNA-binding protein
MKVQHYHDTYEFYLQTSGDRYIFLDDVCYTITRGDLIIFKPFVLHYAESREVDYYERYVMNFHPQKLSFLLNDNEIKLIFEKFDSCVIHLNEEQYQSIYYNFKKADYYFIKKGIFSEKLLYSTIFQMIMSISELIDTTKENTQHNMPPEIMKAVLYINKHYKENIDLDKISEVIGMSKFHFSRLFHRTTGATFLEYLYNIRLTKVHKLLIGSNLPLHKIADKTGFSSTAHLSRTFRKVYQQSPRDFRKFLRGA